MKRDLEVGARYILLPRHEHLRERLHDVLHRTDDPADAEHGAVLTCADPPLEVADEVVLVYVLCGW